MEGSRSTVVPVRLIVVLLVVQILISLGTLVGIVVRPVPPPDCTASLTLQKIMVIQDTDPGSGPNTTDSWRGTLNFSVGGSRGVVFLAVELDFQGDAGYVQFRADSSSGKVALKGETVQYLFVSNMTERDGGSYTGPAPSDFDLQTPLAGPLSCPGVYPLSFSDTIIPLNTGQPESIGRLAAAYLVVLDP